MEPDVAFLSHFKSQIVVLLIVSAYQTGQSASQLVFKRLRAGFLLLESALLPGSQVARLSKFLPYGVHFFNASGAFYEGRHGFQIIYLLIVFFYLYLLLFYGCLRLAVALVIMLGVGRRRLLHVQRDLHGGTVIIAYDIHGLHALFHQVEVRGEKFSIESEFIGILSLQQILGETFLLQVFFAEEFVYRSCEIRRFLLALIGCDLEAEIGFQTLRKSVKPPYFTYVLKVAERLKIVLSRGFLAVYIHPRGDFSVLSLFDAFSDKTGSVRMLCSFICKSR